MGEENRFWRLVVICFTIFFCSLTGSISSCTAYQSHLISKAVKDGADPMQASCSIGTQNESICVGALLRKQ